MNIHSSKSNPLSLSNYSPTTSSRAERGTSNQKIPGQFMEIPRCTRDDERAVTSLIKYFFVIALSFFLFSKNVVASTIEPYDFGDIAYKVTKSWEPDIALYVAKRYVSTNGSDAQNVTVTKLNGGAANHFIYLVFVDNQMKYVLKGLSSKKEADALFALQNSPYITTVQNNPESATICLSKLVQSYRVNNDRNTYYFAMLEGARGKELFKTMSYELLQNKNINKLKDVFYTSGRQISELHKSIIGAEKFTSPKHLSSVIHDDLHPENAFYDSETNRFSLIDNDSMGESIERPLPILRELYGIYEIPVIRWPAEKIKTDLLKDADPHDIASVYYELVLGMASVYQNPQEAKMEYINQIIELNNMAIRFLKDRYSEPWMSHPTDKHEDHIVWGKLSSAVYNPTLTKLYISNLTVINNDLKLMSGMP